MSTSGLALGAQVHALVEDAEHALGNSGYGNYDAPFAAGVLAVCRHVLSGEDDLVGVLDAMVSAVRAEEVAAEERRRRYQERRSTVEARREQVRSIPCPTCGVAQGERCVRGARSLPATVEHADRRRAWEHLLAETEGRNAL